MPLPRAIAAPGKHGLDDTAPAGHGASLSIGLSAVIVAASVQEPRVLTIRLPSRGEGDGSVEALPSGPLEAEHRTLEIGLRTWVERQTSQTLGYVEQLYTFGDRDRVMGEDSPGLPALVVAYLALVREARPAGSAEAMWQGWYRYFPWEDWREGKPESLARIEDRLNGWAQDAASEPERRLRGKIKYRPVVFELMPPAFTLLQLQRTVEALAGVRLHKQNFRRLVEQQGLVEETGEISAATGGRPARLVRFRREVLLERPAPGLRLRAGRRVAG